MNDVLIEGTGGQVHVLSITEHTSDPSATGMQFFGSGPAVVKRDVRGFRTQDVSSDATGVGGTGLGISIVVLVVPDFAGVRTVADAGTSVQEGYDTGDKAG